MPENSSQMMPYAILKRRVLLTLLLMSLTPLVALGLFCLDRINAVHNEKVSAGIESVVRSTQRSLDTFMVERVAQVKNLVYTHSYEELSDSTTLSRIFSILQSNSRSFADLGLIGMDGRHVAYAGPFDLKNANYAEEPWFLEVVRKGVYVSDVFMGFRHVPHFIIAVLRHESGRSFIIRATIDMEAVDALLHRDESEGMHSDAFLINQEGILQTESHRNGHIMEQCTLPINKIGQRNQVTISEVTRADGVTSLAAMLRLESMPWVLIVMDNAQTGLNSLRQLWIFIVLFMILGGALVCVGAVLCTGRIFAALRNTDEQKAHLNAAILQSSKMASLGKMAASVAHEVNNPLMLIQENAGWIRDLLEDEDPKSMHNYEEIRESTQKIEQHVKRAKGVTQRLLGFGRRMNPERTEVLINTLADQAVDMLKTEASAREITIERHFDPAVPFILTDPAQLEQVFINILDNAIDALGRGGNITLTTRAYGTGVQVIIEDNGPGMDAETLRHIFDPFFTTKGVGEGTGLGLAICFSILEKLGGRLEAQSTLGHGTAFTVTLPPEPPQPALDNAG